MYDFYKENFYKEAIQCAYQTKKKSFIQCVMLGEIFKLGKGIWAHPFQKLGIMQKKGILFQNCQTLIRLE